MRILVNTEKCCGCRICELQCSFHHTKSFSPRHSRIHVTKIDNKGFDYPHVCHQCSTCPPANMCPMQALTKAESGGIIVQRDRCVHCRKCAESCSYGAIRYDSTITPVLCDLCGGTPVCVEGCPTKALTYAEGKEPPAVETVFRELMKKWSINE